MAKTKRAQAKPAQTKSTREKATTRESSAKPRTTRPRRAEEYHGPVRPAETADNPGSLEEETLSRDAPYNKTYGLRRK